MMKSQEEIKKLEISVASGGMVTTINGEKKLVKLDIKEEVVDPK